MVGLLRGQPRKRSRSRGTVGCSGEEGRHLKMERCGAVACRLIAADIA